MKFHCTPSVHRFATTNNTNVVVVSCSELGAYFVSFLIDYSPYVLRIPSSVLNFAICFFSVVCTLPRPQCTKCLFFLCWSWTSIYCFCHLFFVPTLFSRSRKSRSPVSSQPAQRSVSGYSCKCWRPKICSSLISSAFPILLRCIWHWRSWQLIRFATFTGGRSVQMTSFCSSLSEVCLWILSNWLICLIDCPTELSKK